MSPLRCPSSSSAARSFVQLAKRQYGTVPNIPTSSARLDFLVPSSVLRTASKDSSLSRNVLARKCGPAYIHRLPSARTFTTTTSRQATVCVQNPQKDEDGNDMTLEITARAAKRLSEIMTKDSNPDLALRIQVESGGCHGFQYLMSLITIPADGTVAAAGEEVDTIFKYVADEDAAALAGNNIPKIILDEPSLDLLKGSKVDFTMELIGSQFKIVDNPLATSSCGCGTSFDIKM